MAKTFLYPNPNLYNNAAEDGNYDSSAASYSDTGDTISNEERAVDASIALDVGDMVYGDINTADCIKIDMGASPGNCNAIGLRFSAAETDNLALLPSNASDGTSGVISLVNLTTNFTEGWNVFDFTECEARYWFLYATTGTVSNLSEIIIGTKYTFDYNPTIGTRVEDIATGVDIDETDGGIEYSNKRHEKKNQWEWRWDYLSNSMKTSLTSLRNSVDRTHRKMLYNDESSIYYVKMSDDSLKFREMNAPSIWQTSIKLTEQLS